MGKLGQYRIKRQNSENCRKPLMLGFGLSVALWCGNVHADAAMGEYDPTEATADEAADPLPPKLQRWQERPLSLELQLGIGGPLGLLGAALDVALLPRWSLGAGAGLSLGGPQVAVFTRVRLVGNERRAFFVEAAFSGGNYRAVDIIGSMIAGEDPPNHDDGYEYRVRPAFWVYVGAGYELRWQTAAFRVSGGFAGLLNPGSGQCIGEDSRQRISCSEAERRWGNGDGSGMNVLPYAGVAFMKTFGF